MVLNFQGQIIDIRKIRHRVGDFIGVLICCKKEIIRFIQGKLGRMVMLCETLIKLLVHNYDVNQLRYWLFERQNEKEPYRSRSVHEKQAAKKTRLTRKVTLYTLLYCFAMNLLDHGTDISFNQEILGHKHLKTTMIYTHITHRSLSSIQSPLDKLKFDKHFIKKPQDDIRNMRNIRRLSSIFRKENVSTKYLPD